MTAARTAAIVLALAATAFGQTTSRARAPSARPWPEAESLFHRDPRWLGADAALSIPIAKDRTLWLFGDTFVATSEKHVRRESKMVRNTVALQTGMDPRSASISFHWGTAAGGAPASFFAEDGARWWWPGHGIRFAEGPLVVFLFGIVGTPGKGLGFASDGWAVAIVDDPDAAPSTWRPRIVVGPPLPFDALPATAVVREGDHVAGVAIRQKGIHAGALVRFAAAALAKGDLDHAEWWAGAERGWVAMAALGAAGPTFVLDDAGAECSVHRDARSGGYVHVASYGFGASTIGVRTAPALTGPWSTPTTVFRPPESDGPRPFVYAAKAHPELSGPARDDLLVTYATNSFEFGDLFTPDGAKSLYWPRFVAVKIR